MDLYETTVEIGLLDERISCLIAVSVLRGSQDSREHRDRLWLLQDERLLFSDSPLLQQDVDPSIVWFVASRAVVARRVLVDMDTTCIMSITDQDDTVAWMVRAELRDACNHLISRRHMFPAMFQCETAMQWV